MSRSTFDQITVMLAAAELNWRAFADHARAFGLTSLPVPDGLTAAEMKWRAWLGRVNDERERLAKMLEHMKGREILCPVVPDVAARLGTAHRLADLIGSIERFQIAFRKIEQQALVLLEVEAASPV